MLREIERAGIFAQTAAFANSGRVALSGNGPANMVQGQSVSGGFFQTMGIRAAAGRLLGPNDDTPSAEPVMRYSTTVIGRVHLAVRGTRWAARLN